MTDATTSPAVAIAGALLGCAVGDALGLPYEGISRRRGGRMLGEPDRHRFVFGRGMVSDDTEHTVMVGQSLCEHPGDPEAFARAFAGRLRWWLLGVPAGIGFATLRSCLKLWLGFPVTRSGVFSAGNGPAMRTAILGAAIDDLALLRRFVAAATTVTHTDPKALLGALAVAVAAWCARRGMADEFLETFSRVAADIRSSEFETLLTRTLDSVRAGEPTTALAERLGCERGVSGYVYRTVPVVLHAWLSHKDNYRDAVQAVIRCGGDTDTTAAIVGGIVGSGVGPAGIPPAWVAGLWEWPRSVAWMEELAATIEMAVRTSQATPPPRTTPGVGMVRNLVFLAIVLGHVGRRVLPPY